MAQYGGFNPGTYQAWALNLTQSVFGTPGIARGFQVTAPGGMTVTVTLDATALDAVCYVPNGGWVRLDAQTSFSVPANGTGGTRTDAIVAFVDPTGTANPANSLTYQTNWAGGFSGTNNQLVIALISVGPGVNAIVSGNISMTSQTAKLGNAGGASNSMVATDGVGLAVQDNSSTSTLSVVLTGLTTGVGRHIALVTTDASGISRQFTFQSDGTTLLPGAVTISGGVTVSAITAAGVLTFNTPLSATNKLIDMQQGYAWFSDNTATTFVGATTRLWLDVPVNAELHLGGRSTNNPAQGIQLRAKQATLDDGAVSHGLVVRGSESSIMRVFDGTVQPTNMTDGDVWLNF